MTSAIDPVKFEVMRSAFDEATEEMAATLRRSAYSTNVKTRQDFSCAYFDADLRIVAQAFTQAVHLGSFVELVPRAVGVYGVENLDPGDMLVINDPYSGGVHLNDGSIIAPMHYQGDLVGYMASLAHHVDVGGGAPASVGAFQEVFQEGIIIPPVKLVEGGGIVRDVHALGPRPRRAGVAGCGGKGSFIKSVFASFSVRKRPFNLKNRLLRFNVMCNN